MKVLIIEDDHLIANSIKKGLEQEKYIVEVSYDGTEGMEIAVEEEFDVIILDVMLPGINGFEICKQLRAKSIHTPILILSAKDELDDKVQGLELGADDYLTKPFAFEELLARIKALLRRPKEQEKNILKCSDLILDTISFTVSRNNKNINLTKKEFALLEYLLKNKNRIISKENLIDRVWEYDSDILPNTVEQYIKYLRQKIGKPNLINTVRGFGYKISDTH